MSLANLQGLHWRRKTSWWWELFQWLSASLSKHTNPAVMLTSAS